MNVGQLKERRPAYAVCLVGPQGSGKTRAGCGFPKVFYIGTDPTGLDTILRDPSCAKLVDNIVDDGVILNGMPLDEVFAADEGNSKSLYGAIAHARQLAQEGKVRTIFLDNLTYLLDPLKWQHLEDAAGGEIKDKRQAFAQIGSYASDLVLSRLLPLATREGINVVVSMHVQRESKDAVEGVSDAVASQAASNAKKAEQIGQMKRHVNLKSDLSPMVMGGLRQKIGGMPSAMLWLNHEVINGQLQYIAYCQKQYVNAWDAEIDAKNRYGLPPSLNLTNASLYATLVKASKDAMAARPSAKAAATSSVTTGEQSPALDAQPNTNTTEKENR